MTANRSSGWYVGLFVRAGLLFLSASVLAAQPVKKPPGKTFVNDPKTIWKLAGREGECAPLAILSKKGPAYANVKSPEELVEKLRANGHQADLKEFKGGTRPAVEVRAPSAGIHVMFLRQKHCDKKLPADKK